MSEKSRISQNPNTAAIFIPAIIGSTLPPFLFQMYIFGYDLLYVRSLLLYVRLLLLYVRLLLLYVGLLLLLEKEKIFYIPCFMFFAMISEPASPNPTASSAPILIISDSKMTVSILLSSSFFLISFLSPSANNFS